MSHSNSRCISEKFLMLKKYGCFLSFICQPTFMTISLVTTCSKLARINSFVDTGLYKVCHVVTDAAERTLICYNIIHKVIIQ